MNSVLLSMPAPKAIGLYKLVARDAETLAVKRETGWIRNIVTNAGLQHARSNSYLTYCHVGSSNVVPSELDTELGNRLRTTNTLQATSTGRSTTPGNRYVWRRNTYRFGAAPTDENYQELGVSGTANGTNIFSHALIKDDMDAPMSFPIMTGEVLDVIFEFRYFIPEGDFTDAFTIMVDDEPMVINVTMRAANCDTNSEMSQSGTPLNSQDAASYMGSGVMGSITGQPTGITSSGIGQSVSLPTNTASPHLAIVRKTISAGLNNANFGAGGIRSIMFRCGPLQYQAQFDPGIPKNGNYSFNISFNVTTGRRA